MSGQRVEDMRVLGGWVVKLVGLDFARQGVFVGLAQRLWWICSYLRLRFCTLLIRTALRFYVGLCFKKKSQVETRDVIQIYMLCTTKLEKKAPVETRAGRTPLKPCG